MTVVPIRIKSGESSMTQYRTFCCYGDTRTGKSRFGGTFPNALFISDASERGWVTLETMPEEEFYHPGKGPIVLPVSDQNDMIHALATAEQWVRSGYIDSVVIDSITFYAESWYQHQYQRMVQASGNKSPDTRALFGALANHLSDVRVQIHKWPCNVAWLALAAPPDDENPGGPMLSGKSRQRFPAGCDHIFYHRRWNGKDAENQDVEVYEIRTRSFGKYICGGRDNGQLPEPLSWPTFKIVAGFLGLPDFPAKQVPDAAVKSAIQGIQAARVAPPSAPLAPAPLPASHPVHSTPPARQTRAR